MALSRPQLNHHLFPMIDAAWKAVRETLPKKDLSDSAAKDLWRRDMIIQWLGLYSTKQMSPTEDFEYAMMRFEELAGNGIRWRIKWETGAARRRVHVIHQICREYDLEETYVRGIARQALNLQELPLLERLSHYDLDTLIKILKAQAKKMTVPAGKDDDNEPF